MHRKRHRRGKGMKRGIGRLCLKYRGRNAVNGAGRRSAKGVTSLSHVPLPRSLDFRSTFVVSPAKPLFKASMGPSQFLRQHSGQAGVVYSFSGQVRSSLFIFFYLAEARWCISSTTITVTRLWFTPTVTHCLTRTRTPHAITSTGCRGTLL